MGIRTEGSLPCAPFPKDRLPRGQTTLPSMLGPFNEVVMSLDCRKIHVLSCLVRGTGIEQEAINHGNLQELFLLAV